jgi:hypothetical protein
MRVLSTLPTASHSASDSKHTQCCICLFVSRSSAHHCVFVSRSSAHHCCRPVPMLSLEALSSCGLRGGCGRGHGAQRRLRRGDACAAQDGVRGRRHHRHASMPPFFPPRASSAPTVLALVACGLAALPLGKTQRELPTQRVRHHSNSETSSGMLFIAVRFQECAMRWLERSTKCPVCKTDVNSGPGHAAASSREAAVASG